MFLDFLLILLLIIFVYSYGYLSGRNKTKQELKNMNEVLGFFRALSESDDDVSETDNKTEEQ